MSNNHTPGSGNGTPNNNSSFASRREVRTNNMTGALPIVGSSGIERHYSGHIDFDQMIQSLHELFERDRQIASQPDSSRCGICYLYFSVGDLQYREEGFYICPGCAQTLGNQSLPMLRAQQKL